MHLKTYSVVSKILLHLYPNRMLTFDAFYTIRCLLLFTSSASPAGPSPCVYTTRMYHAYVSLRSAGLPPRLLDTRYFPVWLDNLLSLFHSRVFSPILLLSSLESFLISLINFITKLAFIIESPPTSSKDCFAFVDSLLPHHRQPSQFPSGSHPRPQCLVGTILLRVGIPHLLDFSELTHASDWLHRLGPCGLSSRLGGTHVKY